MWSSSVIKIVKMKYNRLDIKWRVVSTSFKIYLDILQNLYITFTICYYNTINIFHSSVKKNSVLVNGLYQTESYSLHVMQLIRIKRQQHISIFHTLWCRVAIVHANINCKHHWLAICCLFRLFYFVLGWFLIGWFLKNILNLLSL